jgi:hypothetical protein
VITVERIAEELAAGDRFRSDYVDIDVEELPSRITVEKVEQTEIINLELELAGKVIMDEGEKELLAHARSRSGEWTICSPDNSSIRAAIILGIHERLISLEDLARKAGSRPVLEKQYREKWLRRKVTQFLLDVI